jgi:hypothetical protein
MESKSNRAPWAVLLFCVLFVGGTSTPCWAAEGMYFPFDLARAPFGKLFRGKRGLRLSAKQIQALSPAVVQLARGGTGSFVSRRGLVVTNHHVAYRCLVALDGTSHPGIMKKGYVAATGKDELPCPNYELRRVEKLVDVTAKVTAAVRPSMSPRRRFAAVLRRRRKLEHRCEKVHPDRVCEVRAVNGGAAYTLSVHRRINDVRLVYAPPRALGKYGGDIDNWRYPRHTADFTFLRAYVGPKGRAADYAKGNVPYRPKKHLKVSVDGIRRDSLTMVIGFPGRTMRHSTYYRARYNRKRYMPFKRRLFERLLAVLPRKGVSGRRYGGLDAGLNNAVKYYKDVTGLFDRFDVLHHKRKELAGWRRKIRKHPKLRVRHAVLLERIKTIYSKLSRRFRGPVLVHYMTSRLLRSVQVAYDIVKWSRLRKRPDGQREDDRFRKKNITQLRKNSDFLERATTLQGERKLLSTFLRQAAKLPPKQQPKTLRWFEKWAGRKIARLKKRARRTGRPFAELFARATHGCRPRAKVIEDGVALLFGQSRLYGHGEKKAQKRAQRWRRRLFKARYRALKKRKDPLLQLAVRLDRQRQRYKKTVLFETRKVLDPILRPVLVNRVIRPPYHDANFTQRVAFGRVKDYTDTKKKKTWRYVSRLTWLVRRDRGRFPFFVSQDLKKIYRRRDFGRWQDPVIKDVPVNFTSTVDTTGGNSGSPVLNGRGELVGLLFDGTPESMLSDWVYLPQAQRSICVDIRFVLFLAQKVHGARRVLKELGVVSGK